MQNIVCAGLLCIQKLRKLDEMFIIPYNNVKMIELRKIRKKEN